MALPTDNEPSRLDRKPPRKSGPRSNTAAPSSLHTRLTRQLAGIMAHLEQNPNDNLSRARVDTIKQLLSR